MPLKFKLCLYSLKEVILGPLSYYLLAIDSHIYI